MIYDKKFDIVKAITDPSSVRCYCGCKVRIICWDRKNTDGHCIIALLEENDREFTCAYTINGKYDNDHYESDLDLYTV